MGNLPRIPIRGVESRSLLGRMTAAHLSGSRKVRPLVEYQPDPLGFLVDVLKFPRHTLVWSENPGYEGHTWDGTPDPLVRVCDVLAGKVPGQKNVAVEAATGTQKTFTAAGLVLWFLGCWEDSLVVTTAPMEKQLKAGLWKEIGFHLPAFKRRFGQTESLDLKIRMRPLVTDAVTGDQTRLEKWAAVGWCAGVDAGAESAVRSQGFHAAHMLAVIEETPGMDPAVLTALRNTLVAPHNIFLAVGNPDNQLDPLHQLTALPGVEAVRISAYDHPNVVTGDDGLVAGATSRGFIEAKLGEYGEEGPLFLSRVRGQSPKEAHNALFKLAWLEEAARKFEDPAERARLAAGGKALGVDPAQSENGDRCALSHWQGAVMEQVEKVPSTDALAFGEHVWDLMVREKILAQNVAVDVVGVGSNVVNHLRRVMPPGMFVVEVQGGAEDPLENAMRAAEITATTGGGYEGDSNRFANMRAQVYWQLAQDMRLGLVAMARHLGLWQELQAVTYSTDGGVVLLERKAKIKKKLGRSPDFADAVVYGNWVRTRPLAASMAPPRRGEDINTGKLRESDRSTLWTRFDREQSTIQRTSPGAFRMPRPRRTRSHGA